LASPRGQDPYWLQTRRHRPETQVYGKITPEGREEFKLGIDYSGDPDRCVVVHCTYDLSETDGQRLEHLATKFISNIAAVIFKVH
jgi:hypothetical protein